ncbi:lambda exonuclease family protein [Gluconobacter frateurii]|uniref:Phage-like protein n=1 Tax=Gluconobacter frateurii NRIC 0228 TaxID=1307946 RepID=A0ABQ0QE71_9PROT|nr:lambda exonuclease family protein [Gluconobacter frateurii]GBR15374.1 phage-like protein [Gluconobacter frateurii NRIC 0228]GLP90292.1 exonuclease [Gluconobacter frateurii]
MKIHDVIQGTLEWKTLRLGIPTASEFDKIITSAGNLSSQAPAFAARLVAEIILGRSMEADLSNVDAISRGNELEPMAALAYEFEFGVTTEKVGFITNDEGTIGISPDRLVGTDGMVEIKCPFAPAHVLYMTQGFDRKYYPQVQGQLLFAEREWNDRVSYSDELPLYTERTFRDEPFIKKLDEALKNFHELKMEMLEKVRRAGSLDLGAAA